MILIGIAILVHSWSRLRGLSLSQMTRVGESPTHRVLRSISTEGWHRFVGPSTWTIHLLIRELCRDLVSTKGKAVLQTRSMSRIGHWIDVATELAFDLVSSWTGIWFGTTLFSRVVVESLLD